jgi:hypothetical protein
MGDRIEVWPLFLDHGQFGSHSGRPGRTTTSGLLTIHPESLHPLQRAGRDQRMAAIREGGHTNRASCVAYIFIGVA